MRDPRDIDSDMLVGTPSDEASEILAQGRSGITTLFLSMSERHPDGADAQYLRWHGLDHRPEQHRLRSVRASLRVVSTPACRAARAARVDEFDAVDHVMTYFFTERSGFTGFVNLANALAGADRVPFVLNPVKRGAYVVEDRMAAPRAKAGADVLPWRPAAGVYLLLEEGVASAESLTEVPGVAGLWVAKSLPTEISTVTAGQQLTYCFLDDDPVATAARLRPVLEQRWSAAGVRPLLAAPFYTVVPYEWDRYLP